MKKSFLFTIVIVSFSSAAIAMQTAGETKQPPVELLAEAIDNNDSLSFRQVPDEDKDSLTWDDWRSLRLRNLENAKAIVEVKSSYSFWKDWWAFCTEDEFYAHIAEQAAIESCINKGMKKLRSKDREERLKKIETSLAEHGRLLATLFPEKQNLVPEQPQIVSEDTKQ